MKESKKPLDLLDYKLSNQKVEEKINKLKNKYPTTANILKKIHHINLKKTTITIFTLNSIKSLLKTKTTLILPS